MACELMKTYHPKWCLPPSLNKLTRNRTALVQRELSHRYDE